jgi:hypothetical protein
MTTAEEAAVDAALEYVTHKSINDGIMAAVQMIRIAANARPSMTMQQLADAIESTVTKDQPTPPSFLQ